MLGAESSAESLLAWANPLREQEFQDERISRAYEYNLAAKQNEGRPVDPPWCIYLSIEGINVSTCELLFFPSRKNTPGDCLKDILE